MLSMLRLQMQSNNDMKSVKSTGVLIVIRKQSCMAATNQLDNLHSTPAMLPQPTGTCWSCTAPEAARSQRSVGVDTMPLQDKLTMMPQVASDDATLSVHMGVATGCSMMSSTIQELLVKEQ
jgi:hypothetical protein